MSKFSKIFTFYEVEGVGRAPMGTPGCPRSMLLNAPYHKEQEYSGGDLNSLQDITQYFPLQMPMLPNLTWRKIGQGHPRVTILATYDGPLVPDATNQVS